MANFCKIIKSGNVVWLAPGANKQARQQKARSGGYIVYRDRMIYFRMLLKGSSHLKEIIVSWFLGLVVSWCLRVKVSKIKKSFNVFLKVLSPIFDRD